MDTKALKDKILQLAIQGKLVPQNDTDEPASVLLQKIRNEKEQLIKDKVIKKDKPLPKIEDNEKVFELPNGWEWCRLIDIGQVIGGGTPSTTNPEYYSTNEIAWLTPADLSNYRNKYISNGNRYISQLGLKKSSARLLAKGSVLFSSRAPIGYVAIAYNELCTNQGFKSITPYVREMNEYIYYFLIHNTDTIKELASGTTFKEVSGAVVSSVIMPLPPLEEQKRIVSKIEESFNLIDELESNKQCLLQDISNSRNKVLELAIQGKLVEQNIDDEPARVLIEQINNEKDRLIKEKIIRKEKKSPDISDEDKPFNLPKGWEWVRLGAIVQQITDGAHKTPTYIESGIPFLSVRNISKGYIDLSDTRYISKEEHQNLIMRCNPQKDDLLFCRIGTLGKFKVIDIEDEFSIFVSLGLIKLMKNIYPRFMEYVLNSPELYRQYFKIKVDGSHTSKLNLRDIPNLLIPLPPLAEQERIVEKLDILMAYFYRLESELK